MPAIQLTECSYEFTYPVSDSDKLIWTFEFKKNASSNEGKCTFKVHRINLQGIYLVLLINNNAFLYPPSEEQVAELILSYLKDMTLWFCNEVESVTPEPEEKEVTPEAVKESEDTFKNSLTEEAYSLFEEICVMTCKSSAAVCRELSIAPSTVWSWKNGRCGVSQTTYKKIVKCHRKMLKSV